MMQVKSSIGNRHVELKIAESGKLTRAGIRWAFFMLGRDLQETANREILRKPKHGQLYIVRTPSGRKRRHRASAWGEAHANLTGTLRKSMGWKVRGSNELEFGYGLAKPAPDYAHNIEVTKNRPSLKLSVDANQRNAELHFARQIKRSFAI